jgi:hypothetical protein
MTISNKEASDLVFAEIIKHLRVADAHRIMRTTKIKTGPNVDELPPRVPDGRLPPAQRKNPPPPTVPAPPTVARKSEQGRVVPFRPRVATAMTKDDVVALYARKLIETLDTPPGSLDKWAPPGSDWRRLVESTALQQAARELGHN